jgi:hypothetical protein
MKYKVQRSAVTGEINSYLAPNKGGKSIWILKNSSQAVAKKRISGVSYKVYVGMEVIGEFKRLSEAKAFAEKQVGV